MNSIKRAKLVENMWELEDSAVRVEAAFVELVVRRREVMEELARSSKKELTKTLMNLLEFEKVVLFEVDREEQIKIKEEQKQEVKTSEEQMSEARQKKERMREKKEEKELAVVRGEVTPPNTTNKNKAGSVRRSPGATVRNRARLLEFHQEKERSLPPSRLPEEIRNEERTVSWVLTYAEASQVHERGGGGVQPEEGD